MKKFASLLLALVLCMGLTVPALAEEYSVEAFGDTLKISSVKKIDDASDNNGYYYEVPVGAVITYTVGDKGGYAGCGLGISYGSGNDAGFMLKADGTVGKQNPSAAPSSLFAALAEYGLADNKAYTLTITEEMAKQIGDGKFQIYFGMMYDFGMQDCTENMKIAKSAAPTQPEQPIAPAVPSFTDVKADAYYAGAVKWAVENGITAGTTATTFSPNATCTTAHILTFMWRAAGSPEPTAASPFTNLNGSEYYAKAAVWAYENGMVSGTTFDASKPCTRAATMEYFWKQAGSPKTATTDKFTDVAADSSYAEAVAWAVANGVTAGTSDSTFTPDATCTRAQIVTFLNRALVG